LKKHLNFLTAKERNNMKKLMITFLMLLTSCGFSTSNCTEEECPSTEQEDPIPQVIIGPIGPKGDTGPKGESCSVEAVDDGAIISCGDSSAMINNGTPGVRGIQGVAGQNGIGCTTTQTDMGVQISCGDTVTNILNGLDGQDGIDGQDGQNATPVNMIKFCPNINEVYPSTFPEYGICIDNKIYAVYWNNLAFLAHLTPGRYVTTTMNSNCTFTVQAGTCNLLH
jgi:hypothetical protein